ncbi:hypothetical protein K0T92_20345 [Paenibacillus oenotherae]|uniref:WYL domain-containing protein n=1 Tax=Paenibacillus oenotherae TaxID=1435645 RepID=A0ABS7DC53_9BACL|nr:hypothetical protein [Paenibacillus oenotherae]MBW7477072.1 hypothetical protein [Paenibacillus oenotherae]
MLDEKYAGRVVEVIYEDRTGKFTKRHIEVRGIRNGIVTARCLRTNAPRTFRLSGILAVNLVSKNAG